MTARDRPDGVGHRHYGKAERQSDRQNSNRKRGTKSSDRNRAAAHQNQGRGAEKFAQSLVAEIIHLVLSPEVSPLYRQRNIA